MFSYIRKAQLQREGVDPKSVTTEEEILDIEGRIFLLKGIIIQLDSSLPLALKKIGMIEMESNNFLKKEFEHQIKKMREVKRY